MGLLCAKLNNSFPIPDFIILIDFEELEEIGEENMYIFGGYDGYKSLNDLWVFNFYTETFK